MYIHIQLFLRKASFPIEIHEHPRHSCVIPTFGRRKRRT